MTMLNGHAGALAELKPVAGDVVPQPPLGAASLAVSPAQPSAEFLSLIPHAFARRHLVLSAGCHEGVELVLVGPGTPAHILFNVGVRLKRPIRTEPAAAEELAVSIDRAFARNSATTRTDDANGPAVVVEGSTDVESDLTAAVQAAESDLINVEGKAPSVRLVDLILFEALVRGASDVHVQPLRERTLVRYRLDGALHTARELPASLASSVIGRIKVMGRLDVAEKRSPQDGRATVNIGGSGAAPNQMGGAARRIDLRISTLPSTFGERVVIRLLDPSRSPHLTSFAALGMPAPVERRYLAATGRTSGIVLSTGPTGSGKTTTLYTTLAWIASMNAGGSARGCELNMMTIEDPVEYDLSGPGMTGGMLSVSQTQVDPRKNLTFATGLRHILRQDPDVIMVGEVRDQETAKIAVQASLTGHLVLSTLHTNDAAGAIARLLDLGVEPFLAASSLSAVLAQRLVRKTHAVCAGRGCADCLNSGFRGRTGVFELLSVDGAIRDLIGARASAVDIKATAQRVGMVTLRDEGSRLVRQGLTSAAEVTRVIEALDEVET
ncbi:MAG: type II/IV secretion system protein [Phycisphaerales bacterium]|nr:type II/IV secretion system protein [Phycisphaerales bacterium]